MKVLFCNFEYPPLGGGGGVMNAMLAEEMAKKHEVVVLTSHGLDAPRQETRKGVRIVRVPVFFRKRRASASLLSMLAFLPMGYHYGRILLEQERFDAVNTHFVLPSGPVGAALAHDAGVPNLLSLHGGDLYDPSKFTSPHRHPVLRAWVKRLIRSADQVIGQSTNTLHNMKTYYTPEIQGTLIPLGINRPQVSQKGRADFGFSDGDILLVTVGRLIARKGLSQLIQLMKGIDDPRVKLLIVGTGVLEDKLKEEVSQYGLNGRVCFMGFVEEADKFAILRMSDIYVSTTQHEGFCLAFLEAMSMGLPVITYNNGGHMDYLKDGNTGFLVPLNDLEMFRLRSEELIHQTQYRKEMSVYNTHLVENYYIDNCARRYESVFQAAIAARNTQPVSSAQRRAWSRSFQNKASQVTKLIKEKQAAPHPAGLAAKSLKEKQVPPQPSAVPSDEPYT